MHVATGRETSPHARITGVVYLAYFVAAISAQVLTAKKALGFGLAMNLLADALYLALTFLLYRLLRPVSRTIALIAAVFSVAGCALMVLAQFHLVGPRLSPLIFFGPFCVLLGYLIMRSAFLPQIFGALLILAGIGWLLYPTPGLPQAFASTIQVLGFVAEALLMSWLLLKGVSQEEWLAQNR